MPVHSIVSVEDFNIDNVIINEYSKGKKDGFGSMVIKYKYAEGAEGNLTLCTPKMRLAFNGANNNEKYAEGGLLKWSFNPIIDPTRKNHDKLRECIVQIETKARDAAFDIRKEWMSKLRKKETFLETVSSVIKKSKSEEYNDTLRVSIMWNHDPTGETDGSPAFAKCYNTKGTHMKWGTFDPKGRDVKLSVQVPSVWCISGTGLAGITLKLNQAVMFKKADNGGCVITVDEDEQESDEEEEVQDDAQDDAQDDVQDNGVYGDDADDDYM